MPNMVRYFHLRRAKVKYVKTAPETVPAKAIQFKDIVCSASYPKIPSIKACSKMCEGARRISAMIYMTSEMPTIGNLNVLRKMNG